MRTPTSPSAHRHERSTVSIQKTSLLYARRRDRTRPGALARGPRHAPGSSLVQQARLGSQGTVAF